MTAPSSVRAGILALGLCAVAFATSASEVQVTHAAVERLLVTQVLTQEGRLYLEGQPGETCRYAFVQEPKVSGADGRLVVRFVFSGRAGVKVAGRCAGPGDTVTVTASGVPTYTNGELSLADLKLDAPDSAYFRVVAPVLQGQVESRIRFPVKAYFERALADASASGVVRVALGSFDVQAVGVDPEGLRIRFDGSLRAQ